MIPWYMSLRVKDMDGSDDCFEEIDLRTWTMLNARKEKYAMEAMTPVARKRVAKCGSTSQILKNGSNP